MTTRTCAHCQTALAADAHPTRKYCSDQCRYRHRDAKPTTRDADTDRHRHRYTNDTDHREQHRKADRDRYRTRAGIPLDKPLSPRGRPTTEPRRTTP